MVSPSRSSTSSRQRDHAGKIVVGVLILLGLIASVFLIFSNNVQLIRVGLVAALWAAALAALAATRYRRDAAIDQAKTRDLQKVYELQLEREITARREYELGVESRVRREVGADAAELAALRTELSVLRESLHRLFDGDLLVDRPALRAEAVRVQELTHAAMANGNSQETDNWDAWSSPSVPLHVVSPVFDPDHPEPPAFASPYDDPVTAETAVVSAEPSEEDSEEADETRQTKSGQGSAASAEESSSAEAASSPGSAVPRLAPPQPAAPMGTAGTRRRRHADSDEDQPGRKLTVAEIMANLRSEQNSAK
ncbi:DUF6779 domain-containing protein [Nocardia spumae]|uniref:DUF6779 domain-containing protein n=1 Tax=Nocardia spumae TaxID=2887190 RepID=UPI001D157360|nr:DUF6779 domain-containing protein [Nocardia spumae]